jgi:thymidine phosphorylase
VLDVKFGAGAFIKEPDRREDWLTTMVRSALAHGVSDRRSLTP